MLKQIAIYLNHHDVEPKRMREWKKDIDKINDTKSKRQRLEKGLSTLDIWERRRMLYVSRKMIMQKAKTIFDKQKNDYVESLDK